MGLCLCLCLGLVGVVIRDLGEGFWLLVCGTWVVCVDGCICQESGTFAVNTEDLMGHIVVDELAHCLGKVRLSVGLTWYERKIYDKLWRSIGTEQSDKVFEAVW
jgi:hypothetical protein